MTDRLTARQKATVEETMAYLITAAERLSLVDGSLRNITAPTDLELEALRDLRNARVAINQARRILRILRAGGVVP